ncbi:MAG: hypothetical protein ACOCPQ_02440, partial [Desulfosudaceae bacterium]
VVDIKPVDAANRFEMNLSSLGMEPGETVYIIAFIDNNFADSPALDSGDYIGFYHPPDSIKTAYQLKAGDNDNLDIRITREVFDLEAEIGGTVYCDPDQFDCPGGHEVTIVAYAGPISSSDFSSIDPGRVIGYETFAKASFPLDYTLSFIPCLPYGQNLPVENVHLLVFLDNDHDGEVNAGDVIGSYADSADDIPRCLTVFDGMLPVTDLFPLHLMQTISDSAGADLKVSGRVTLPYGGRNTSGRPVVVAVGETDAMSGEGGGFSSLDYFKTIPPGRTSFELDLSGTGRQPGDEVVVTALWDKDYGGCFPDVTPGDMVGFYSDFDSRRFSLSLEEGGNTGLVIDINREVFDFEAEIGGTIHGDNYEFDGGGHEVTIVAYAGRFTSSNFDDLDPDGIIGYKTYSSAAFPLDYTLTILPYGHDVPIENAHLAVFVDTDDDGQIGAGDIIGYHALDAGSMPAPIAVTDGLTPAAADFDIYLMTALPPESPGHNISIRGNIERPAGYGVDSEPVFIIVSEEQKAGSTVDMDFSSLKYFERVTPAGAVDFDIDLSSTSLEPGDRVSVMALWDKDFNGFPVLTPQPEGDLIGIFMNKQGRTPSLSIELAEGVNPIMPDDTWEFKLNKRYYDHNASLLFQIENYSPLLGREFFHPGDQLIVVALTGQGVNEGDGFRNPLFGTNVIDPEYIVGYDIMEVQEDPDYWYGLDIWKIIRDGNWIINPAPLPGERFLGDVYLFAVVDEDGDGLPADGDAVGFYPNLLPLADLLPASFIVRNEADYLDRPVKFWAGSTY